MKTIIKITLAFLMICNTLLYAQEESLTTGVDTLILNLEKCRMMAIENSELMKMADETINKAEYQKKAARAAYLPNVKASAMGMYSEQEFNETASIPIIGQDGMPILNTYAYMPIDITTRGGVMAGVSAEQPLYAGGKIVVGNNMAKIGTSMAADNKELKRTETIYEADQMYYFYISTREKVALARIYKNLLSRLYEVVNDSYETGMSNRNDVLKVKVQSNEVALQLQKAESGLELSRMSLCRILGVPFDTPLSINDSISGACLSTEEVSEVDVTKRIEYQFLDNQVKMAEQNVKMVRGDYMPTAGVSVGYNYYNVEVKNSDNYDNSGLSVIARLEIPITTFGERKGKVKAENSEVIIKQLELQRTGEFLRLEIEQARLNLIDAHTRVEMAEEALEQADENMRVAQDSYDLGMETIVNLLEAQASWQEAYSNKIDAKTDCQVKTSYFLKVTNKL